MDSYTPAPPRAYAPVPAGPRAYRSKIRAVGPFVALVPPAVVGALGLLLLRVNSGLARGLGGFLAALFAAPVLPVLGVPFESGSSVYLTAIVASAVVWFVLGLISSRRATRGPIATWRDFWAQQVWLVAGVWVGVLLSLVVANLVLGRSLL